jgi:hypothetical protein
MNTIETGKKELLLQQMSIEVANSLLDSIDYKREDFLTEANRYLELAHERFPDGGDDLYDCYELRQNRENLIKVQVCDNLAAHIMKFFK